MPILAGAFDVNNDKAPVVAVPVDVRMRIAPPVIMCVKMDEEDFLNNDRSIGIKRTINHAYLWKLCP